MTELAEDEPSAHEGAKATELKEWQCWDGARELLKVGFQ